MILGTAGHIDHGKTTLVRALTGVDTDRLPEEKRRGITIDLGFAPLRLDGVATIGVVDVPGHEAFVRTMLAGATGVDVALLVIAADEGVMPQTREHLAILDLLGVRTGIVALTKCDLVDDEWLALVTDDVRALLQSTPLADAPVIPTSATTGEGLDALRRAIADAVRALPARDADDLFRMPIDRAFSIRGTGTVVTGTVWTGRLKKDSVVRLLPDEREVRVRGLQSHGESVDVAEAGSRTAVALVGVDVNDVARGKLLVDDRAWHASDILRAEVALLDNVPAPLKPRTVVRFHVGTTEVGARVVARGGAIVPGERRGARVVLDQPVVVRAGDRFVLRTASPAVTIGGGVVVDPVAPRRARPWTDAALLPARRLELALAESGASGLTVTDLPVRLGVAPPALPRLLKEHGADLVRVGDRLVARAVVDKLTQELEALLADGHRARPLEPGLSLQLVRSRLDVSQELADHLITRAVAAQRVEAAGGVIRLAGWKPRISDTHRAALERLMQQLVSSGDEPPSVAELRATTGDDTEALLRVLERDGQIVQVEPGRYYPAPTLTSLVERLRAGMQRGREYSPSELRELLGFSRKFLIPLLEYCDKQGHTQRGEAGRTWRGA